MKLSNKRDKLISYKIVNLGYKKIDVAKYYGIEIDNLLPIHYYCFYKNIIKKFVGNYR